jgi:TolB-like protein/DNA-binding winged helix-turn-helix (wHTH) protein/tetratricopeptide (TPR) repeat protein
MDEFARMSGRKRAQRNRLRGLSPRKAELDRATQEPLAAPARLEVAGCVIDLGRQVLLDGRGQPVELRPQAYQVLRHLALNAGRLVTRDELTAAVWPGIVVTDDSLVQAIGDVRRALGDAGHEVVKTIPRRGYMLVAGAMAPAVSNIAGLTVQPRPLRSRRLLVPLLVGVLVLSVTAAALWSTLHWGGSETASADPGRQPSIAVLPFKGPQGDPDGDVLARGVAADLVSELARSPDLRVVSHQSSFELASGQTPLAEIGKRLGSRYIVDGTVQREGEQLRIAVELLDSQGGHVVWSSLHTVDRTTLDPAQHALVSRIAGTLQTKVSRTEERRAVAQPPKTLDVYVLTAHGKSMMQRYSAQGMRESRRFYEQALAIDPSYAPAWVFLGMTNTIDVGLHLTGEWDESRLGEVLAQVRRAIALQPDLPIAYVALSQAQALARNFDAALAAAQQTCDLSPNDADCFYILGKAQLEMGQVEPAARNLEKALDRNPIPPAYLPAFYATALWGSGRLDEAVRVADDCLAKAPDFWRCRQDRTAALVELGRVNEAREEAARLLAQLPQMTARQFGFVFADSATALRERRVAAARVAGVPSGAGPSNADVAGAPRSK